MLYLVLGKFKGKCERKEIERKNRSKDKMKENKKNKFKVNKLFLYTSLNSFHLFSSSV